MLRFLSSTLILVTVLLPATLAHARLGVAFDQEGPTKIEYRSLTIERWETPRTTVTLEKPRPDETVPEFADVPYTEPAQKWDPRDKTLHQRYEWGIVSQRYDVEGDRLVIETKIRNTSPYTISKFVTRPLSVLLPPEPEGRDPWDVYRVYTLGSLGVVRPPMDEASLLMTVDDVWPPVRMDTLGGYRGKQPNRNRIATIELHGQIKAEEPGSGYIHPHGMPRIAPDDELTLSTSLRFAPAGTPTHDMIPDLAKAFRERYPHTLEWEDRRPIAMMMLASHHHKTNKNPRGWFFDKKRDYISEDAGPRNMRERLDWWIDRSLKVLEKMDAQGLVVWNIEGEEHPHPTTYIGHPELISELAPEMDAVDDHAFKRFRDAGYEVGVCLRPTQVYWHPQQERWKRSAGNANQPPYRDRTPEGIEPWQWFPTTQILSDQIQYAKDRWGAKLFYIDTNLTYRPWGEEQKFVSVHVQADVWQRLMDIHPDILLIPELTEDHYGLRVNLWATTAPYLHQPFGKNITPADVRKIYPDAFSVINLSNGDFDHAREQLVEAVRRGDILMGAGWYNEPAAEAIRAIYEDAAKPEGETGHAADGSSEKP